MRMAAVGDLHCGVNDQARIHEQLGAVHQHADVLVLAGDLTNYGQPAELEVLIAQLVRLPIPVFSVLGNHDYESGLESELLRMLRAAGVCVLDAEPAERDGVGFAGVKGFCGGFGASELTAFGEPEIKAFVRASMDESLRLERALGRLRHQRRVVVTHYSPIAATAAGEAPEIQPFMGSSRLSDACDRFGASVIVHGHCHRGSLEGRTRGGIQVYNVALPLLAAQNPPAYFRVIEV